MIVNFYNTKIIKNELNKSLGTPIVKSCSLKDGVSVEDPVIYLGHDATIFVCNYAYIPDFGRYYFVTGKEVDGKTDYITLHVDVLMSFKNDIKASKGTATRSNFYNKNIPDTLALELPEDRVQYRKLSNALTGETYIAIIGG